MYLFILLPSWRVDKYRSVFGVLSNKNGKTCTICHNLLKSYVFRLIRAFRFSWKPEGHRKSWALLPRQKTLMSRVGSVAYSLHIPGRGGERSKVKHLSLCHLSSGQAVRISKWKHRCPVTFGFQMNSNCIFSMRVVGYKNVPQRYQVLVPRTCECDLIWVQVLANVIKLRVLKWDCPVLCGQVRNAITCVLRRARQREIKNMEETPRQLWRQTEVKWTLTATGSWKRQAKAFLLELPEGGWPCQRLDFGPVILILDLWPPGWWKNK